MKILLDAMFTGLKPLLNCRWLDVKTVQEVLGAGARDEAVIKYSKENDMIIVTEDVQIPKKAKEIGAKVVLISKEDLAMLIQTKLRALQIYLNYTRGEM